MKKVVLSTLGLLMLAGAAAGGATAQTMTTQPAPSYPPAMSGSTVPTASESGSDTGYGRDGSGSSGNVTGTEALTGKHSAPTTGPYAQPTGR